MLAENKKVDRLPIIILMISCTVVVVWGIVFKCNMSDVVYTGATGNMSLSERFMMNLPPFKSVYEAFHQRHFWGCMAVVFNVVCFIPFGGLLRFLQRERGVYAVTLAFVFAVELFQLFSGFGGFDFTDVFLNWLGAYIGCRIYAWLYPKLSLRAMNRFAWLMVTPMAAFAVFAVVRTLNRFPEYLLK